MIRKDAKAETPPVIENRPMSQISDYNVNTVLQAGMTSAGNNRGNCSSLVQTISGVDDSYDHMFA